MTCSLAVRNRRLYNILQEKEASHYILFRTTCPMGHWEWIGSCESRGQSTLKHDSAPQSSPLRRRELAYRQHVSILLIETTTFLLIPHRSVNWARVTHSILERGSCPAPTTRDVCYLSLALPQIRSPAGALATARDGYPPMTSRQATVTSRRIGRKFRTSSCVMPELARDFCHCAELQLLMIGEKRQSRC